jgi:hypothetical protein
MFARKIRPFLPVAKAFGRSAAENRRPAGVNCRRHQARTGSFIGFCAKLKNAALTAALRAGLLCRKGPQSFEILQK